MYESTLTSKGQTTLPSEIRRRLGLKPGDKIRYVVLDGEVRLLPPVSAMDLCGALKSDRPPVSVEEMDAAVKDRAQKAPEG